MHAPRKWLAVVEAFCAAALVTAPALAATSTSKSSGCPKHGSCSTTTPPTIQIVTPNGSGTVSGAVNVSGTSSDASGVATVAVAVDGGAWQTATGTTSWSWSWSTASIANGTHSLAARATDKTGNVATTTMSVSVSNTQPTTASGPSVVIDSPSASATVSGSVTVAGTAADNGSLTQIAVQVDSGAWQNATGTSSWSWAWATAGTANGMHTVTARATDGTGQTATTVVAVNVSNTAPDATPPTVSIAAPMAGSTVSGTVSVHGSAADNVGLASVDVEVDGGAWQSTAGTTSWSWSWATAGLPDGAHTVVARATDTSGNQSTATVNVTTSNAPSAGSCSSGAAPLSSLVTPEGARIRICTADGGWTTAAIAQMLRDNAAAAGDLSTIAPTLTIEVQDTYATQTAASEASSGGRYTSFSATIYLDAVSGGVFATMPDYAYGREYGHVWHLYYLYMARQGDWSAYLNTRWDNSDGSVKLGQDPRLDSNMIWSRDEIFADDYRLLFGSAAAISEHPSSVNLNIPDPGDQPGLGTFLLNTWRTSV